MKALHFSQRDRHTLAAAAMDVAGRASTALLRDSLATTSRPRSAMRAPCLPTSHARRGRGRDRVGRFPHECLGSPIRGAARRGAAFAGAATRS